MKLVLLSIAANATSITCVIIAGMLIMKDKSHWGWFLLLAALLYTTIDSSKT